MKLKVTSVNPFHAGLLGYSDCYDKHFSKKYDLQPSVNELR